MQPYYFTGAKRGFCRGRCRWMAPVSDSLLRKHVALWYGRVSLHIYKAYLAHLVHLGRSACGKCAVTVGAGEEVCVREGVVKQGGKEGEGGYPNKLPVQNGLWGCCGGAARIGECPRTVLV